MTSLHDIEVDIIRTCCFSIPSIQNELVTGCKNLFRNVSLYEETLSTDLKACLTVLEKRSECLKHDISNFGRMFVCDDECSRIHEYTYANELAIMHGGGAMPYKSPLPSSQYMKKKCVITPLAWSRFINVWVSTHKSIDAYLNAFEDLTNVYKDFRRLTCATGTTNTDNRIQYQQNIDREMNFIMTRHGRLMSAVWDVQTCFRRLHTECFENNDKCPIPTYSYHGTQTVGPCVACLSVEK